MTKAKLKKDLINPSYQDALLVDQIYQLRTQLKTIHDQLKLEGYAPSSAVGVANKAHPLLDPYLKMQKQYLLCLAQLSNAQDNRYYKELDLNE